MIHSRIFRIAIISLFSCLYFTSQAIAGVAISKSVSIDELAAAPQNLTFYIYEFKDDSEPTLIQQFGPGEWQLSEEIEKDTDSLRFKVTLNDLEQFSGAKVWVQMAVDGVITGELTPLATNEPGISVEGFVESRVLGFKFPDGTTQTTAAGGGDNLGNHIATQNIRLGSFWLSGDGGNEGVQIAYNGKVGIAEAPGIANLQVAGIDGVVFTGDLGSGSIPASGAGTRMMWYPRKGAFRAGRAVAGEWDDANIGTYSVAFGGRTTASGEYSTAMGQDTTASGHYSTAMGFFTTASGGFSTAMGQNTTASGYFSTAMGLRTSAPSFTETVIGSNNTTYTPISTNLWDSNDRLFVIGNGVDSFSRSNAMVVLKNGNTTLNGTLQLNALGIAGGTDLCRNASNELALCSSSGRYKDNIEPLKLGLETVRQLQPVMFNWKAGGQHDLGFVAEDVGAIDRLLVIHNNDGEIEGVKYKQLTAVLVNAVQSQQTQYAGLQTRNTELQAQTVALQSQTMELKSQNMELQSNYEQLQAEFTTMREQQQQYARMVMKIKQQLEQRPLLTSANMN